jgi:periplasmic divalent cation tolerance protein
VPATPNPPAPEDKLLVFTTCDSAEQAGRLARLLVERRLAACATITPGLTSIYHWRGAVEQAGEWGIVFKSRRDLLERLIAELKAAHPYETPEIVAVPIAGGLDAYLAWLDAELEPRLAG